MRSRDVLRRYPLFAVLDAPWLDAWLDAAASMPVEIGQVLFQAGTPGEHLYLVQSGKVRVFRPAHDGLEVSVGRYQPGDLLGEYALLPPGLNAATCRAAQTSQVLRLPLAPLRAALDRIPEVRSHLKRWLRLHALLGLRRGGLFLGFMSATSVAPLLSRFESVSFRAAHTVQADGLSDDRFFVIESGEVCVQPGPDEPAGQPTVLGPGDSFGVRALLGRPGLPSAVAHADAECLSLRREAFYQPFTDANGPSMQTHRERLSPSQRARPWVGQREAADCGVAALAMIARFHGRSATPDEVRSRVPVGERGASLLDLQRAGETLGFRSRAVRVAAEQLAEVALPAIAHLAEGHYVVIYAREADGLVIGDPARGVVTLTADSFRRSWTGNLLLLSV